TRFSRDWSSDVCSSDLDLYFAQPIVNPVSLHSVGEFLGLPGSFRVLVDLALLGAFGGLYSVPLYAMIQERAERQHLSRIIAANNILNALFMVAAAGLAIFLLSSGVSIPPFFLLLAFLNCLVVF